MIIIGLSAASMMALVWGVIQYRRAKGLPFMEFILVIGAGIGLIPALCAAGLTVIRYAKLDGWTRLIGLAPAVLLPLAILYFMRAIRGGRL